jgi:hypothetical protein
MPKEIYPIPGTKKNMVVEKDNAGNLISVKDDEGKPAQKVNLREVTINIKCEAIDAAVIEVPDGTTFVTKHNPTCRWYFICGNWYYICWG